MSTPESEDWYTFTTEDGTLLQGKPNEDGTWTVLRAEGVDLGGTLHEVWCTGDVDGECQK